MPEPRSGLSSALWAIVAADEAMMSANAVRQAAELGGKRPGSHMSGTDDLNKRHPVVNFYG
jgi:hypothetical protein